MLSHSINKKVNQTLPTLDAFKNPEKLQRRSGSTFTQFQISGSYDCYMRYVQNGKLIHQCEAKNPWKCSTSVLGEVLKVIDTKHIESDNRAVEVVQAELERVRGEKRDPTLQVAQLTTSFWFNSTGFTTEFAIYKPVVKS